MAIPAVTPEQYDACFDEFTRTAWHLATRRRYVSPGEDERIRAFEQGEPLPVRSVATSAWMARIAVTTATAGKSWEKISVIDEPPTPYQRYGLLGLVESQAAGMAVHVVPRSAVPELELDFWLFDAGTPDAFMLLHYYDRDDVFTGARRIDTAVALATYWGDWDLALERAGSLNAYLASRRLASRVA